MTWYTKIVSVTGLKDINPGKHVLVHMVTLLQPLANWGSTTLRSRVQFKMKQLFCTAKKKPNQTTHLTPMAVDISIPEADRA